MKIILSSRRHHYAARVSIFLVMVALIAAMVGCGGPYNLNIASTDGGDVTVPGEGTFTRDAGTMVLLVATPDTGYHFNYWSGDVGTIADVYAASTTITMNGNYSITAKFAQHIPMVAAGGAHTVGLKSNGTVVAVGLNSDEQCDVGNWTDIDQVAAGGAHTVGLKFDHTVVAVGDNYDGQCNVGNWTDIIQVAAGYKHTVGLKSDHTVVAVGYNGDEQCDVDEWTDIIQVAAGDSHTVGLKSDGTVVAVGSNLHEQCDVGDWTDIDQVAAGNSHTVGLKSDHTVVAVGDTEYGQCNVDSWTDIITFPVPPPVRAEVWLHCRCEPPSPSCHCEHLSGARNLWG
jgi:hypothetical protein